MDRFRLRCCWCVALCLTLICGAGAEKAISQPFAPTSRVRFPVAAAFLHDDQTVAIANRTGSVSVVDLAQGTVCEELLIGERLASLAALPDGRHLLVVDEGRHELLALRWEGGKLHLRARLPVTPYPTSVVVLADGSRAAVAELWSRGVQIIDLTPLASSAATVTLRVLHTVPLSFAPRMQLALPGRPWIVVADAFGGHLAVVDGAVGRVVADHELNGHNLRGLAWEAPGKNLLVAHQILNEHAATTQANIEHGLLMANVVRVLPLDVLLHDQAKLEGTGQLFRLGSPGRGAGDPAGIALTETGQVAVCLGGVDEVALLGRDGTTRQRLAVGRRPTVILAGKAGRPLLVVNTFDDSLSLLDVERGTVTRSLTLGPRPALKPQERGELQFYSARLGRDGWLSCQSCHSDGHTNGLLADTLGDNSYGTPKRTLTLRATALTDPWAWNGSMKYLQDQVHQSLVQTMHSPTATAETVNDLVTFLHTLPPPPPRQPVTDDEADRRQVERGRQIFQERGCVRCHIPSLTYTSQGTYDVGFADERGQRRFNPPSLRGVGQGRRFLHDNRAATLEEVFTKFRHKVGPDLPDEDRADLLRFLRSL